MINQDLRAPEGREAKDETISPSANPRIFWKCLTAYPPQQQTVHFLTWNWRGMGEEYISLVMAVPSSIATGPRLNYKPTAGKMQAGSSQCKGWVSRYWWLHACQCLGNYSKSWFCPCQGKQRCPVNGLAPAYSNHPAFLGIGKLSSCLKDPKDVWPTCLFINFLLWFVPANRCNKYHSVERKARNRYTWTMLCMDIQKPAVIWKLRCALTYRNY